MQNFTAISWWDCLRSQASKGSKMYDDFNKQEQYYPEFFFFKKKKESKANSVRITWSMFGEVNG